MAFAPVTSPEGVVWGLPMDIYPLVTYYNIDFSELAGLATPNDLRPTSGRGPGRRDGEKDDPYA